MVDGSACAGAGGDRLGLEAIVIGREPMRDWARPRQFGLGRLPKD
jgi:hypothetical protein